jgi:hypothetical protein
VIAMSKPSSKLMKQSKKKAGRKRAGAYLGPRVPIRLHVRPDTSEQIKELARVRQVPANMVGQAAFDCYFGAILGAEGDADGLPAPSPRAQAAKLLSDRSAREAIRKMKNPSS